MTGGGSCEKSANTRVSSVAVERVQREARTRIHCHDRVEKQLSSFFVVTIHAKRQEQRCRSIQNEKRVQRHDKRQVGQAIALILARAGHNEHRVTSARCVYNRAGHGCQEHERHRENDER